MKNLMQFAMVMVCLLGLFACAPQSMEVTASENEDGKNDVKLIEKQAAKPLSSINWDAEVHDFGNIPKDEPVRYTFTFTNTGNEPLILENVKSACGCTTPSWTKEPVAPGETGEIVAEFNAKSPGNFAKTLTVTTNTEPATHRLTLKGMVEEG